jgi:putative tryptophan/tyrosine transport system substrate-binding protein
LQGEHRPAATNPTNDSLAVQLEETKKAARTLDIELTVLSVKDGDGFPKAMQAAADATANSILMMDETVQMSHRFEIAQLALQHRLILVGGFRETSQDGAMLSYGPNRNDMWRRAATYVDKIFSGTNPADLPIEQPVQFVLFINLNTAKCLGVAISPEFLAHADEVVE